MGRPRLLDLFCGAGGAAMGYHRAGFDIVGVDIKPQPHYPFEFHQGDAMIILRDFWEFIACEMPFGSDNPDAIHASPPCQAYVRSGMVAKDGRHPDLLPATREALLATGLSWVIENVPGAPMRADVLLCGSMFGLAIRRHRLFESNVQLPPWTPCCDHSRPITGVYGHPHGRGGAWRNGTRPMLPSDKTTWSREMGIDWMTPAELAIAIPPAYTEWIGQRLIETLGS